ncbi:hypothetical protein [Stappia sp. P2PMeth1]|uniref:hypothetical protein n=1 Tax=Stappia sp. P2PMeth1 TaxID=2003586 RepID=UPI0016494050|nr:hypothetical protein [Stappia sp. P2PMeth1]
MSSSSNTTAPAVATRRTGVRPGFTFYVVVISAVLLFSAEIWTLTLGTLWAFIGILSLGSAGTIALAVLLVPGAAWATWRLATLAIRGELALAASERERLAEDTAQPAG